MVDRAQTVELLKATNQILSLQKALSIARKVLIYATEYQMNGSKVCHRCGSLTILSWADGFGMAKEALTQIAELEKSG